jgi:hypothetical protein
VVLNERECNFLESYIDRANLELFLFLINVIPHSMCDFINYNVLLLIIEFDSDLSMNSSFHPTDLDVEGLAMQEIKIIRPDGDVFLLFGVFMCDSDCD